MAEHHTIVERSDSGAGTATGLIVGVLLVLVVAIVFALFMFMGGPGRYFGGMAPAGPSNGYMNAPAPAQGQPQSGPQINVPDKIDVNINVPPAPQQ